MREANNKNNILFILLSLCVVFALHEITISVDEVWNLSIPDDSSKLAFKYAYLEDKTNSVTPEDINSHKVLLKESSMNDVDLSYGDYTYWYQIKIQNKTNENQDIVGVLDNPAIDYVNVYEKINGKYKNIEKLGNKSDTKLPYRQSLLYFSTSIDKHSANHILVSSRTLGSAALPINFYDKTNFKIHELTVHLIWGSIIGVILIMMTYNFVLFCNSREVVYLYYIGYIFSILTLLSCLYGFSAYIFPSYIYRVVNDNIVFVNYIVCFFAISFAVNFLKFHEQKESKVNRFSKVFLPTLLLASLTSIFIVEYISYALFLVFFAIGFALIFLMIVIRVREKVNWAGLYIISWLPILFSTLLTPLQLSGYIDYNLWTRYALLIGAMFEIMFISLALAERIKISESNRLFESHHHPLFGLANQVKLTEFIKLFRKSNDEPFSIIIFDIKTYDDKTPYYASGDLKEAITTAISEISNHLVGIEPLEINKGNRLPRAAILKDGTFAFISRSDEAAIKKQLKSLSEMQPMNYKVNKTSINFTFYASSIMALNNTDVADLINQSLQEIETLKANNKLYSINQGNIDAFESQKRKTLLASDLQSAIENNELALYHQPQKNLIKNEITRSEVLVRWAHEKYGLIPTPEFICIAEKTGVINKLTRWAFETSCQHLTMLKSTYNENYQISINISCYDVTAAGFIAFLIDTTARFGHKSSDFILEITETAAISDQENSSGNIRKLSALGFSISIDDFGTGYSSFEYLTKLPFDELKIDRQFVADVTKEKKNEAVVTSTLSLAKELDITVVAEGVEDDETLSFLKKQNCETVQGYYILKPSPISSYLSWLISDDNQLDIKLVS
ncbi:EAL domain-containing protein [Pseudomonadota bacterium]|nr:EAL domain-containing protein [Pseudomonadota bacterium]